MPNYFTFVIAPGGTGYLVTITGMLNGAVVSVNTYDIGQYTNVGDVLGGIMANIPLPLNNWVQ